MNPDDFDREETETRRIDIVSMKELVFGAPRSRRVRFPVGLVFVVLALLAGLGCATAPRPIQVEAVGELTASYHSVASAPVHASTDLTPSFGAVDTDDDAPAKVTVGAGVVDAPEVASKGGLVVGEAR
jgi:hypothetical protein